MKLNTTGSKIREGWVQWSCCLRSLILQLAWFPDVANSTFNMSTLAVVLPPLHPLSAHPRPPEKLQPVSECDLNTDYSLDCLENTTLYLRTNIANCSSWVTEEGSRGMGWADLHMQEAPPATLLPLTRSSPSKRRSLGLHAISAALVLFPLRINLITRTEKAIHHTLGVAGSYPSVPPPRATSKRGTTTQSGS